MSWKRMMSVFIATILLCYDVAFIGQHKNFQQLNQSDFTTFTLDLLSATYFDIYLHHHQALFKYVTVLNYPNMDPYLCSLLKSLWQVLFFKFCTSFSRSYNVIFSVACRVLYTISFGIVLFKILSCMCSYISLCGWITLMFWVTFAYDVFTSFTCSFFISLYMIFRQIVNSVLVLQIKKWGIWTKKWLRDIND
jgi:hypothetical protein